MAPITAFQRVLLITQLSLAFSWGLFRLFGPQLIDQFERREMAILEKGLIDEESIPTALSHQIKIFNEQPPVEFFQGISFALKQYPFEFLCIALNITVPFLILLSVEGATTALILLPLTTLLIPPLGPPMKPTRLEALLPTESALITRYGVDDTEAGLKMAFNSFLEETYQGEKSRFIQDLLSAKIDDYLEKDRSALLFPNLLKLFWIWQLVLAVSFFRLQRFWWFQRAA